VFRLHCLGLALAPLIPAFTRAFGAEGTAETLVRVEPRESGELLANPGMGWQTFHRFADEDKNLAGLPSASAYFRFYWREIEPAEGEIDFSKFDELLAHARKAGQKLAFRIMCTGSGKPMDVPAWLKEKGCNGTDFIYERRKCWVPDFSDSRFQEAHFRLIRALGARYDGHPDLDLVDIGSVGLWGEWHMSSTRVEATGKPVPLPAFEVRMAIINAWCKAFPRTSKVILIGSDEGMARAVAEGYGWRADCLGDMGGFSKNWNHMENFYLQQVSRTGAEEAWKKAPVAFESCWDMRKWKESGWDIRYIFDYALRCHVSYLNNKSAPLPEGTRPEIERFLKKMGYRLVLRSLEHPEKVQAGGKLNVRLRWENIGVAPPYRDYRVAVRLSRAEAGGQSSVAGMGESIQGWLPGARENQVEIEVPGAMQKGVYDLAVAVVEPASQTPEVKLATQKRGADGWHTLSRLKVE
jgi:hypothetical protein